MSAVEKQVSNDISVELSSSHYYIYIRSKLDGTMVWLDPDELEPTIAALQELLAHTKEE